MRERERKVDAGGRERWITRDWSISAGVLIRETFNVGRPREGLILINNVDVLRPH